MLKFLQLLLSLLLNNLSFVYCNQHQLYERFQDSEMIPVFTQKIVLIPWLSQFLFES